MQKPIWISVFGWAGMAQPPASPSPGYFVVAQPSERKKTEQAIALLGTTVLLLLFVSLTFPKAFPVLLLMLVGPAAKLLVGPIHLGFKAVLPGSVIGGIVCLIVQSRSSRTVYHGTSAR